MQKNDQLLKHEASTARQMTAGNCTTARIVLVYQ